MTDEIDNELDEEQAPKGKVPDGPLAGERLATARREQQISVNEVAKELHLDEPKVRAIEHNDFQMLGAPVFAKGHLRKYAALVGVDPDDVLQDYYRLTRAQGMPPVVGKVRKQAREISPGPWIALIVALLIAAIAYWWFVARDASLPTTGLQPVPNTQASDPGSVDVESAATILGVEASLPPSPEPQSAVPQSSTPEAATPVEATGPAADNTVLPGIEDANATAPLAVAAGELRLSLSFSGECWTEVTDANGRRLFFDLGRAGRNVNVSGEAPLSVLFGNAENVSVQVNGSDYEIQAADRRGQTARFSVSSP